MEHSQIIKGSSKVLVEPTDSGAARGSNPLILKKTVSAWRADHGQETHISQKPLKNRQVLLSCSFLSLHSGFLLSPS